MIYIINGTKTKSLFEQTSQTYDDDKDLEFHFFPLTGSRRFIQRRDSNFYLHNNLSGFKPIDSTSRLTQSQKSRLFYMDKHDCLSL